MAISCVYDGITVLLLIISITAIITQIISFTVKSLCPTKLG